MAGNKDNKNKKYGRNKKDCTAYSVKGSRLVNKAYRLLSTFKKQPNNTSVRGAMKRLSMLDGGVNALRKACSKMESNGGGHYNHLDFC